MPFDATTGRVYAPVSVDDVRMALGLSAEEPGAGDVGYLCSHNKINPYSLIRPQYFLDTTGIHPDTGPEAFANDRPDINYCVPAAKKAEVIGSFLISELPCAKEYDFAGGGTYSYKGCRWGYFVPYISWRGQITDLFALRDLYWKRFGPNDDAKDTNGLLTTTWYCLPHFDGYLHDTEPDPVLSGVVLSYGQYPQCTPTIPTMTDNYKVSDILNLGTGGAALGNNPGGRVSIPAVFSDTGMTYGVSLFRKSGLKYEHVASKVGRAPGDSTDGDILGGGNDLPILKEVVFTDKPLLDGAEMIFIPWVTDAAVTNADAGQLNVPSGANFYGLNFDEKYKAYVEGKGEAMQQKVFTVLEVSFFETALTSTGEWNICFTLQNLIAEYPLTATINPTALIIKTNKYPNGKSCKFDFNKTGNNAIIGVYKPDGMPIISGVRTREYHLSCTPALAAGETVTGFKLTILCIDNNNPVKLSTEQVLTGVGGFETKPPVITGTELNT